MKNIDSLISKHTLIPEDSHKSKAKEGQASLDRSEESSFYLIQASQLLREAKRGDKNTYIILNKENGG